MLLTHSYVALLASPQVGKACRTRETKIAVPAGENAEASARAHCQATFRNYTITDIKVKKIAAPRKSISLNIRHDYITLTAQYADGTVRYTKSFGGAKVTGTLSRQEAGNFLNRVGHNTRNVSPVNAMNALKALADAHTSAAAFVAAACNHQFAAVAA